MVYVTVNGGLDVVTLRDSSQCDVCDKEQTIIHLYFECKYVEKLCWIVDRTKGCSIQSDNIICGCAS